MAENINLIPDSELIKVQIKDNGEHLVYIKDFVPEIVITIPGYIQKEGSVFIDQATMARINVAQRLKIAQGLLPIGYKLRLNCGYRSLEMQKKAYNEKFEELKNVHPDWNSKRLKGETDERVAPLEIVPPHCTGGAVDISIIDKNGNDLDMGTKIGEDADLEKIRTDSSGISPQAQQNRQLLIKIMTVAGFVNYPVEWWHWTYGDRYWAAELKKKYSIYGCV